MRWAPLNGWQARPDGWLFHPDYAGWLRSRDGRWWGTADVDEGRVEMTEDGPRRVPGWFVEATYPFRWVREPDPEQLKVEDIRRRLEEVTG